MNFTDEQKQKAVEVLSFFNDYGIPVGVGIYNSAGGANKGTYKWAKDGSTGYYTNFTDIICTPSQSGSNTADIATFTGDTDGSDNWEYICVTDFSGSSNAEENYPAFNYVNTYATTFGLTGTFKDRWYMPSLAELCYIYRNKSILNTIISSLDGIQLIDWYYSSSQNENKSGSWQVNFTIGYVGGLLKYKENYVCVVRPFE